MVTRIYEWDKNETGWTWIEVTENKVINLILRSLNNLIKVNANNEVYTDLQLEDWIENSDTLPIWVNVGRVLQADGRPVTWTLISGQTTSWDRVKLLYGDDWNIYTDNGTGTWNMLWVNVKAFYLTNNQDTTTAQEILDRILSWKAAIVYHTYISGWAWDRELCYIYCWNNGSSVIFRSVESWFNQGNRYSRTEKPFLRLDYSNWTITNIVDGVLGDSWHFLDTGVDYSTPYSPQHAWNPATKKYVDDRVVISDTAPDTPSVWQFWYNTQSSVLRLYDGTQRLSI